MNDIIEEYVPLPIKKGVHYIVTKGSPSIPIGTPLYLEKSKSDSSYTLFLLARVSSPQYSSSQQRNDVRYFISEQKVQEALNEIEVSLDLKYAREKIDEYQKRIMDLERTYFREEN